MRQFSELLDKTVEAENHCPKQETHSVSITISPDILSPEKHLFLLVVEQEGMAISTAVGYTIFYTHFNEILTFNLLPQVSLSSFLKSQGMALLLTLVRISRANRRHQKFSKYEIQTKKPIQPFPSSSLHLPNLFLLL